jgi:uncharacterized delta-60 repeat protein
MFAQFKRLMLNAWLLTTLISLLTFTIVLAASGDLDTTFSGDGWVVTEFPGRDSLVNGIAIQSNGKTVVAGDSRVLSTDNYDFGVARYNPNGSPDATFSGDGKLVTDFGKDELGRDVALQSDNKIVVVGQTCVDFVTNCDVALARYNPNGKLDTTFSGDGKVVTNYGGANNNNGAFAIALQANGKIVLAGYRWNGTDYDFAVYRYNANGNLDTTFSNDGVAVGNFGIGKDDFAYDLVIQGDGKIVVAGSTGVGSSHNFAIARLNANGTADTTFSGDGRHTTNFGGDEYGYGVALQPNGKIVVVGEKYDLDLDLQLFAIARYNSNGSLDTTFNGRGTKVISIIAGADSLAEDVVVQSNGKIVVLGTVTHGSFPSFALVRLNSNGSFDTNFSGNGKARIAIGSGGDIASAIAIQPSDGKYVVGGSSWVTVGLDFILVRVLP